MLFVRRHWMLGARNLTIAAKLRHLAKAEGKQVWDDTNQTAAISALDLIASCNVYKKNETTGCSKGSRFLMAGWTRNTPSLV